MIDLEKERGLFIDSVHNKNWIDKNSIESDYKFQDGKFVALKKQDEEYADWLNIGWDMWQASANREGCKLIEDLLKTVEWHIEDCSCSHPMSQYELGWFEAMSLVKEKINAQD